MIRVCTTKLLINRGPLAKAGGFLYSLKTWLLWVNVFREYKNPPARRCFAILSVTMAKKTTKHQKALQQPSSLLIVLATIIVASMLAYSVYILIEAFEIYLTVPQMPVIIALESAKVVSAFLPIIVGLVVFLTAQGARLRRFVVASVYIGMYWLAKTLFVIFVPTFTVFSGIFGEEVYRNSGVNFFLEYLFGSLVALIIYSVTKKRTMVFNWLTVTFLIIAAVFLLIEALGYFLR
jgi:hypothetical protein